ncbi:MAG: cytochrome c [Nonlabens sp.]
MRLLFFYFLLSSFIFTGCKDSKKEKFTIKKQEIAGNVQKTPLQESMARGKEIYSELCVTCHMGNGKGVPGAFPPLNPSNWLENKREESIHAVKYGLKGPIEVNGQDYNNVMMPLGLDDQEVADVMNYTVQTWNSGEEITIDEVKAVQK